MLEWAIGKKGILGILVRSVMSLYEAAKTRVRVDSELSEVFEDAPRICVVTFSFSVVVDVAKFAREGAPNELLYADDLLLMSETIEGLKNKFL